MGLLVNGVWQDQWYDTKKSGGKFIRTEAQFRHFIDFDSEFTPDSGRYHLYVSLACPWAHRTLIYRSLKDLDDHISVSVVNPYMLENGWTFEENFPGTTADHLFSQQYLYQIYLKANSNYSGRVTVPVLWDKKNQTIVSNESSEIIRMFNYSFNKLTNNNLDFYFVHSYAVLVEAVFKFDDLLSEYAVTRHSQAIFLSSFRKNNIYGCQFHPEFTSKPKTGHPLFNDFIKTAVKLKR